MRFELVGLIALFGSVGSHLTTVCTSTAPSTCNPATLVFFFGTYHNLSPGDSAPGTVYIEDPDGVITSGGFSDICNANADASGTCPIPDLKANCGVAIPSDAYVTCYKATPSPPSPQKTEPVDQDDSCDAFPDQSGTFDNNQCNFYATVTGATSGTYTVWTTGTDYNLDPCGGSRGNSFPCAMSSSRKYEFDLAVAGCGDSCMQDLPIIENSNYAAMNDDCVGMFDGCEGALAHRGAGSATRHRACHISRPTPNTTRSAPRAPRSPPFTSATRRFICPVSCVENSGPKQGTVICQAG